MVGAATRWKAELGHLIDSCLAASSIVRWGAMGVCCFASLQAVNGINRGQFIESSESFTSG
jgi:hypothetical protein